MIPQLTAAVSLDPADVLRAQRMQIYFAGGEVVDLPVFSEILPDLWMGGLPQAIGPGHFGAIFNLHGTAYPIRDRLSYVCVKDMKDADVVHERKVERLAELVNRERKEAKAPVLVHCQGGLNRSGIVTALALMRGDGMSAPEAIALLREKRSPLVLFNQTFESWLRRA